MRGARRVRPDRRVVTFVVLAYVLSWSWWLPMAIGGTVVEPGQGWPTHLLGLLGPAIAAVATTAVFDGRAGVGVLVRRGVRWRVGRVPALVIAATVAAAALLVGIVVLGGGAAGGDWAVYSGAPRWGPLTLPYVLVVNGFGEEIGWRGYLVDRLQRDHDLRTTSLTVWIVWAVWHLPLFWVVANFRDFGIGGTLGWIVGILFGSIVLAWLYDAACASILAVAVWHTAYNFGTATEASAGLPAAVLSTLVVAGAVVIMRRSGSER